MQNLPPPYVAGGPEATTDAPSAPPAAGIPGVGGPPMGGEQVEAVKVGAPRPLDDIHIDELLHIVVDRNCSDLHICNSSPPIIREDGALKKLNYVDFTPQQTQRMMYEIISDEHIQRFETTLELDFSYQLPRRARFRVNLYRDRGAVAAAFRLISNRIPTVRELNLPPMLETLTDKPCWRRSRTSHAD